MTVRCTWHDFISSQLGRGEGESLRGLEVQQVFANRPVIVYSISANIKLHYCSMGHVLVCYK